MPDLAAVAQQIKAEVEQLRPRDHVFRPIPFGGGMLVGKFGMLPPERIEEVLGGEDEDRDTVTALMIADSCQQICHLNGTGKPEPMTHDDGRPVRFDKEFAKAFDLPEPGSAADVVKACWSLEDGSLAYLALRKFGDGLFTWMEDTTRPLLDELVGESRGARP